MNLKKKLLAIAIAFPLIISAQVTIGSAKEPVAGALLQLKENDEPANSSKGMSLPRVALTDLRPSTDAALAASLGNVGEFSMAAHMGLVVYNLNKCLSPVSYAGMYVWDGTQWVYIGNEKEIVVDYAPAVVADWGNKVWKHKDQNGNDFYSAVFGSAGRWMTTSLAATSYDPTRTASDTNISNVLDGPSAYSYAQGIYKLPVWCYPDGGKSNTMDAGKDPTTFLKKPTMGLLYNWAAASNSRGGTDGAQNTVDEGGSKTQPVIQGICPAGWHLPSDYEVTVLENAIIQRTALYSSTPDIAPGNSQFFDPESNPWGQYRGTHASAMTDICARFREPGKTDIKGTSFKYNAGGFDIFYTGYADALKIVSFGNSAFLWTSSTTGSPTDPRAFRRGFEYDNVGVNRNNVTRQYMGMVRCKKD